MRIGVNVRLFTNSQPEGVGRYMYESLKLMTKNNPQHTFVFFFDRNYDSRFIFSDNIIPVVIKPKAIHAVLWYIWFEWRLPYYLKKYKIDVFLSPDGFGSSRTKVPTCLVVHDLAYIHYPQFFKKATARYYKHFTPLHLKNTKTIAVVSESTRQDVLSVSPIQKDCVFLTYCSAGDEFQPLNNHDILSVRNKISDGHPYFFFVGALHPRKNIINLLKSFELICKENHQNIKLVIAGRLAWHSEEIKHALSNFTFKDRLIYLGSVNSEELPEIMAASFAVVYPSFFEGFGIPILESMFCEVPVITSNTSSMPEVGGNAALYADPDSPEEIALQMRRLLTEPDLRESLIKNGKIQRKKFSWDYVARELTKATEMAARLK
jgi:glycosyltransferase involved in cell wall biosynthesis